jgi:hypothetical protein
MVCTPNPLFIYTRYPCDYDDPRPAIDTKGLPITVDLQTPVKGEVVNRQRESILAVEEELGIKPSGTYTTVRARLDALESLIAQGGGGGGGGGGGVVPYSEILPVSFNGQTAFTLSVSPLSGIVELYIGGLKQDATEFVVSGTSLTYNGSVSLLTSDVVEVVYFINGGFIGANVNVLGVLSLSSSQNDYSPAGWTACDVLLLNASVGGVNITGFNSNSITHSFKTVINTGLNTITLKNQDSGSLASNRILTTGSDVVLISNQAARLFFDPVFNIWRVV